MNLRSLLGASALILFCATTISAQEKTGDLKVTFKLKGDIPALSNVNVTTDKQFCGKKDVPDDRLIVDKESKGIKNVVVYIYTGSRGGTKLPKQEPQKRQLTLDNKACIFEPHVILAQAGDKLQVNNPDAVGHNTNLQFLNNDAQNFTVPSGGSKIVELVEPEPAVIPIACNIHPWMKAYVLVAEHPFVGISDDKGVLEIKGIPVGAKVAFRAWHEIGTFKKEIHINGKKDKWSSNKFTIEIKPGANDLGTVEVPVEQFSL